MADASLDKLAMPKDATEEDKTFIRNHLKNSAGHMNEAEGTDHKEDEKVKGLKEALDVLMKDIAQKKQNWEQAVQDAIIKAATDLKAKKSTKTAAKKGKTVGMPDENIWEFAATRVYLAAFGRPLEDLYCAMLVWSQKDEDRKGLPDSKQFPKDTGAYAPAGTDTTVAGVLARWAPPGCKPDCSDDVSFYNVSKAIRRLESYATWMSDNRASITEGSLKQEDMKKFYGGFGMLMAPKQDKSGLTLWVIDITRVDDAVKNSMTVNDHMRFWCWSLHLCCFDTMSVRNGVIFVEDLGYCGWRQMFDLVPKEVQSRIDKLSMGSSPIKVKQMVMLRQPWWVSAFMAVMKLFLSAKMRARIVLLKDDWKALNERVGADVLPKGFGPYATGDTTDRTMGKGVWRETATREAGKDEAAPEGVELPADGANSSVPSPQ